MTLPVWKTLTTRDVLKRLAIDARLDVLRITMALREVGRHELLIGRDVNGAPHVLVEVHGDRDRCGLVAFSLAIRLWQQAVQSVGCGALPMADGRVPRAVAR